MSDIKNLIPDQERQDQALSAHIASTVGYGGIYRSTPTAFVGSLTTSPLVIDGYAYDAELSSNPIGVTQDLTAGTLTVNDAGIWHVSVTFTGDIVPVTANASNTVVLGRYNVTDSAIGDQLSYFTVPRYGEDLNFSLSVPIALSIAEINKEHALAIWVKYETPTITLTNIIAIGFHLTKIAGEEAL